MGMEMGFVLKLIVIFLILHESYGVIYRLNEEDHALMPPVYHLDGYEECFQHPEGFYCMVNVALVSDTPSPLLEMIHEYSAHTTTHLNHTNLHYGLCVTSSCRKYLTNNAPDLRYTLEACLNDSLWGNYQLKTKVVGEFLCHSNKESITIDTADVIVAIVCLIIILLNLVGSLYDIYCTENNGNIFLLCFSLRRNWKKLVASAADGPDPRLKRLKGLHCIRTISTTFVILAHSIMPGYLLGQNSQFIENLYDNTAIQILCNGSVIMQTFLIISGFLLVYNMHLYAENNNVTWTFLPKAILSRWLRLTPVYAIVLALTATWLRHAGSGPHWQNLVITESTVCRRSWLYHLLYINNYRQDTQCMGVSWYLATDTQLYILGIIIWVTCTTMASRKLVMSVLFLAGMVFPALHVYFQDLDGILITTPENIRSLFAHDPTYNEIYKRSHTNLSGYVIGLALGHFVYHCQKNGLDVQKYKKYRIVYWSLVPIGIGVILFGIGFYADSPRASLLTRVVFAAFRGPLFGSIVASLIAGMVFKYENLYRGFMELSIWTIPGRVSFCAYLVHGTMIKYLTAMKTSTIQLSYFMLFKMYAGALIYTYAIALPLWLLAEAPMGHLVKLCLSPRKSTKIL